DDGSHDETARIAAEAGAEVIRHPLTLGKGAACRSGFHAAIRIGCDAIIMLDGDGQHDPGEIDNFVAAALRHGGVPCIILGNRMGETRDMPWIRRLTNRTLSGLISFLARQRIEDSQCGMRLIHREILERVDYENNRYDAESEILVRASRAGYPIHEVPIQTIYGNEYSKINVYWDTLRFIRFFFRHFLHSPPVKRTPAHDVAACVAESSPSGSESRG
ncbi:MAG: glycosyltransferase family 2 protein, partial [Planctomycetes bacterium]|nr:glycosyltransferase family 2 protein [Planctomycetota bacterium]